jgi:hypothetical protein
MDERGRTRGKRQETREKARNMGGETRDEARDKRQGKDAEENRKITAFLENASSKHFIFWGKKFSTTFYFPIEIFS